MNTASILTVATDAAKRGGEVLMKHLRDGVAMRDKVDSGGKSYDLVSDADLESEREIARLIQEAFPEHELLGEEQLQGDVDAEHLWIIDPLDGTNNFAHSVPHFAVSIAYYHRGEAVVGVVFNPSRDELYTAERGNGAYFNGSPVHASRVSARSEALIGCGFYYDRGDMMRRTLSAIEELFGHDIHGIRRMGTASLDLCYVGCGQLDAFFEYQLSPWDFAAGQLFVTEAGGQITDAEGAPLGLTKSSVLATNRHLHSALCEITRKHHPSSA